MTTSDLSGTFAIIAYVFLELVS